jgi:hypothetical protein
MDPQPDRPTHSFREPVPVQRANGESHGSTTSVKSILCSKCEVIRTWVCGTITNAQQGTINHAPREAMHLFANHESGIALEQSYKAGCHLCTLLWVYMTENSKEPHEAVFLHDLKRPQAPQHAYDRQRLQRGTEKARRLSHITLRLKLIHVTPPSTRPYFWAAILVASHPTAFKEALLLSRGSSKYWDVEGAPNPERWPISTDSPASLELVKSWARICANDHPQCNRTPPATVPTRLLQVPHSSDGGLVRLVETADLALAVVRKYAALSYCWGGSSNVTLTASSYERLTTVGIPKSQLPATIQDALTFTAAMDLDWLWVDSLCIIQDSVDDWSREASRMTHVYQGCEFSIAARGALHSNEGMFSERDPLRYASCQLFSNGSGTDAIHVLSPYLSTGIPLNTQWPLDTRGWVVQERILPRRTIKFGPYISWECREAFHDEFSMKDAGGSGGRLGQKLFKILELASTSATDTSIASPRATPATPFDLTDLHKVWKEILYTFSTAGLTSESDRLVAISGIIATISKATGLRNKSGLWEHTLAEELLWATPPTRNHPETGLMPTWSWISLACAVHSPVSTSEDGTYEVLSQIRDCTAEEYRQHGLSSSQHVALCFDHLHLTLQPKTNKDSAGLDEQQPRFELVVSGLGNAGNVDCNLDNGNLADKWSSGDNGVALPLIFMRSTADHLKPKTDYKMYGLLVKPSARSPRVFERAGMFEWRLGGADLPQVRSLISDGEYRSLVLI